MFMLRAIFLFGAAARGLAKAEEGDAAGLLQLASFNAQRHNRSDTAVGRGAAGNPFAGCNGGTIAKQSVRMSNAALSVVKKYLSSPAFCWRQQRVHKSVDVSCPSPPSGVTIHKRLGRCHWTYPRPCARKGRFGVCWKRGACQSGYTAGPLRCTKKSSPICDTGRNKGFTVLQGLQCFEPTPAGFTCPAAAGLCSADCPSDQAGHKFTPCGVMGLSCGYDKSTCSAQIAEMSLDTAFAAASTAALIFSAGASSAATTGSSSASKVAVKPATATSFKAAASANLASVKKMLLKPSLEGTLLRRLKQGMIKKGFTCLPVRMVEHTFKKLLVGIIDNAQGKTREDMDKKDFSTYDPSGMSAAWTTAMEVTGIQNAVDTSKDPDASTLAKSKAIVDAIGTFDPTGWFSAAAAFMHPKCHNLAAAVEEEEEVETDPNLVAYWDYGSCGPKGNDYNWHWCGRMRFECQEDVEVPTSLCDSGRAFLLETEGGGRGQPAVSRGGCNFLYFAQYACK